MAVGMTSHLFQGGTTASRFSQINKFRVQLAHSLLVVNSIFIFYFISVCSPPPPPLQSPEKRCSLSLPSTSLPFVAYVWFLPFSLAKLTTYSNYSSIVYRMGVVMLLSYITGRRLTDGVLFILDM